MFHVCIQLFLTETVAAQQFLVMVQIVMMHRPHTPDHVMRSPVSHACLTDKSINSLKSSMKPSVTIGDFSIIKILINEVKQEKYFQCLLWYCVYNHFRWMCINESHLKRASLLYDIILNYTFSQLWHMTSLKYSTF